jgi:hypothetical protein
MPACMRLVSQVVCSGRSLKLLAELACRVRQMRSLKPIISLALVP